MPNKTTIGERAVLLEKNWLLPKNESISFQFEDEEGDCVDIKIEVLVSTENNNEKKPALKIGGAPDNIIITFTNWDEPFGNSTAKPIVFAATADGRIELSFLANITKISNLYRVEFQIMSEVNDELT